MKKLNRGKIREYIDLGFVYTVNVGCKVGTLLERCNYKCGLDQEDEQNLKELAFILQEPLREGMFKDCVIIDIFPMVRIENE